MDAHAIMDSLGMIARLRTVLISALQMEIAIIRREYVIVTMDSREMTAL